MTEAIYWKHEQGPLRAVATVAGQQIVFIGGLEGAREFFAKLKADAAALEEHPDQAESQPSAD